MPPCQGGCREFEPRLPLHKEPIGFFLSALYSRDDSGENRFCELRIFCRERRSFAKVRIALEAKTEDSFNAKNPRHEPRLPLHFKKDRKGLFLLGDSASLFPPLACDLTTDIKQYSTKNSTLSTVFLFANGVLRSILRKTVKVFFCWETRQASSLHWLAI